MVREAKREEPVCVLFFLCLFRLKITYVAIQASIIPGRLETFQIFCLLYDSWWLVIVWQGSGPPQCADHRWWDSLVTIRCSCVPAGITTKFNSYWILLVQSQAGHNYYHTAVIHVRTILSWESIWCLFTYMREGLSARPLHRTGYGWNDLCCNEKNCFT